MLGVSHGSSGPSVRESNRAISSRYSYGCYSKARVKYIPFVFRTLFATLHTQLSVVLEVGVAIEHKLGLGKISSSCAVNSQAFVPLLRVGLSLSSWHHHNSFCHNSAMWIDGLTLLMDLGAAGPNYDTVSVRVGTLYRLLLGKV